jgi:hypothetical protein
MVRVDLAWPVAEPFDLPRVHIGIGAPF